MISVSLTTARAEPTVAAIMLEDVLVTMNAVKDKTAFVWAITVKGFFYFLGLIAINFMGIKVTLPRKFKDFLNRNQRFFILIEIS